MSKIGANIELPDWLDSFIFNQLGGKYNKRGQNLTVIDWGPTEILDYLGTYFPRSYAESYCIFGQFLQNASNFFECSTLSILDFGCGTGGEIFGLATAITEFRPNIKTLNLKVIDGNPYALTYFDNIKDEFNRQNTLQIICNPSPITVDDFYDLSILEAILHKDYDIIISFKAVCEFVTKQQFEEKNAYEHLSKFMLSRVSKHGIMLLADVTTKNNLSQEWLPNMMDKGLASVDASVIARNYGHNESFIVSHSRRKGDISKIAWRLISSKNPIKN